MELPDIYCYMDYRRYLADYYKAKKSENSKYSYRYFARKVGYRNPSMFLLVIRGERNISQDRLQAFANALGLKAKERRYFEDLVLYNQCSDPVAKAYYYKRLCRQSKGIEAKVLSEDEFEYISKWYYPVIREMVCLRHFREDPKWISLRLGGKVSAGAVRKAIAVLLRLGLLERRGARLYPTQKNIDVPDGIGCYLASEYHKKMALFAGDALGKVGADRRYIAGITVAIGREKYKRVLEIIKEMELEIMKELDADEGNDGEMDLYQFNIQLFPLTVR